MTNVAKGGAVLVIVAAVGAALWFGWKAFREVQGAASAVKDEAQQSMIDAGFAAMKAELWAKDTVYQSTYDYGQWLLKMRSKLPF